MNESQSADLICSATGDPPISLYWNTTSLSSNYTVGDLELLGLVPFSDANSSIETLDSLYYDSNSTFQVLSIYQAEGSDNGIVNCIAENDVGQEVAEAALEINGEKMLKYCINLNFCNYLQSAFIRLLPYS